MVGAAQLDLLTYSPQQLRHAHIRALREALPPAIRFGTVGWNHRSFGDAVWPEPTSERDLELHGLRDYATHYRFATVCLQPTAEPFTEGTLRRYAAQLPAGFPFFVAAHRCVTAPRLTRGGGFDVVNSKVNPEFLDAHYFDVEVWRPLLAGFGRGALDETLAGVWLEFPRGLAAAGIQPATFAERLDQFLAAAPEGVPFAIEVREPACLTLDYARVLAAHGASHVFTTAPGMPAYAEQAKWVPTGRHTIVRLTEPVGAQYPSDSQRCRALAELVAAASTGDVCVLVDDAAEGDALQTIDRLIEGVATRLDANASCDVTLDA